MIIKTYKMTDLRDWIKIKHNNTASSEEMYACSSREIKRISVVFMVDCISVF